jgi:hypothetical protein
MAATPKRQRPKMSFTPLDEAPNAVSSAQPAQDTEPMVAAAQPLVEAGEKGKVRQQSRIGKRAVTFYLNNDAFKQIRMLSVQTDRSIQDLMQEATDWLFLEYGLHRIAKE